MSVIPHLSGIKKDGVYYGIRFGVGAPSPSLGHKDELYIDRQNFEFYGPKTEAGWGDPFAPEDLASLNPVLSINGQTPAPNGDIIIGGTLPTAYVREYVADGAMNDYDIGSDNINASFALITLNGVIQRPNVDYTIIGRSLSFTSIPEAGYAVGIRVMGFDPDFSLTWGDIEDRPTEFPPAPHDHANATEVSDGFMSAADKTKLDGVSASATANDTDANLKNRANHTGSQEISTITGLQETLDDKASLVSPAFTGIPTAPTATIGTDSDQIATMSALKEALGKSRPVSHVWTSDGVTSQYVMDTAFDGTRVMVTIDGMVQVPDLDYTISDNTITLLEVPVAGSTITAGVFGSFLNEGTFWDVIVDRPDTFPPSPHTHDDATPAASGFMSSADKTKLDGIATGATANDTDANLKDRSKHTGAQAISTVTGLQTALDDRGRLAADQTWTGSNIFQKDVTTFKATGGAFVDIDSSDGSFKAIRLRAEGKSRWAITSNTDAVTGDNSGANFDIRRYDDAGVGMGVVFTISRATGSATFAEAATFSKGLSANGDITRGYTVLRSSELRYKNTSDPANGSVDLAQVTATRSAAVVFRNSAGARQGFIGDIDSDTMYISADVANIRLNRRPTFGGNLAWDAGNLNWADAVLISATNLGRTGAGALRVVKNADLEAAPTGYNVMTAPGSDTPSGSYGYFFKTGRRDNSSGWSALWQAHGGLSLWIGQTVGGGTAPEWAEVWTSATLSFATTAEVWAGTATNKVVSPKTLADAVAFVAITPAVASSGLNFSTFINATITLTGNLTLGIPSGGFSEKSGRIRIVQDSVGNRTLSLHSNYILPPGFSIQMTAYGVTEIPYTCENGKVRLFNPSKWTS